MPLIEVHLIEKVFSPEQKRQIIQKLTDAMVSIEGENMRGVTQVKISEVTSGERRIGDKPLATDPVKEPAPKCGWVLPETPIKRLLREVQQPAPGGLAPYHADFFMIVNLESYAVSAQLPGGLSLSCPTRWYVPARKFGPTCRA